MSDLSPLTANPSDSHVLLLDGSQPLTALLDCAELRLSAAYGLLDSVTCMTIKTVDRHDLINVSEAARVLVADALDLYKTARALSARGEVPHG